jgi:hypothetical protein
MLFLNFFFFFVFCFKNQSYSLIQYYYSRSNCQIFKFSPRYRYDTLYPQTIRKSALWLTIIMEYG